jgi:PAS domain S-box-containing protein
VLGKNKWLWVIVVVVVLFAAGNRSVRHFVILPSFRVLERAEARKDVARCLDAIHGQAHHLQQSAGVWALWDDTYAFIQDRNPGFIESNLAWESLEGASGINLMYFCDTEGRVVWGEVFNSSKGGLLTLGEFPPDSLGRSHYLLQHASVEGLAGLMLTEQGFMLVSARPVLTTRGQGPSVGTVIMGRFLDSDAIATLGEQTKVRFTATDLRSGAMDPDQKDILEQLSEEPCIVRKASADELLAYGVMADLQGNPALLLTASIPRDIMAQGRAAAWYASVSLSVTAGLIGLFLIIWFAMYASEYRNRTARIEALVAKRTEELRESEETFRAISDSAQDAIVMMDNDGAISFWNDAAERTFGYASDEVLGKDLHQLLAPKHYHEALQMAFPHFQATGEGGAVGKTLELTGLRRDGTEFPCELSLSAVKLRGRWHAAGIMRDITSRKQTQEALIESQKRFHDIALSSSDWLWETDAEGRYTYASGKVEEVLGYSAEELMGQTPFDLMPPEEAERIRGIFSKAVADKSPVNDVENWNRHKDGHLVCLLTNGLPTLDEAGNLLGYRGVDKDITERKRAEESINRALARANEMTVAAEAANTAKSEFLANMSHEIRTPLNGVIGMTGLLLDTALTPEQREYADTVRLSGEALLALTSDILDFSKIEAGKLDLENIDFDLRTAIDDTIDIVAAKAHEKQLELACLVEDDVPFALRGDPGRLRQILLNLANNAVKFTHEGEIVLRVRLDDETGTHATVRFSVTDTGIGIREERMDRLFRSFSQVDSSTTRKHGGTGLGLIISKQLAEMMGGTIGAGSRHGQGSTFWFTVVFEKQPGGHRRPRAMPAAIQNQRVLVVDDNETNRKLLCAYLEQWDCRCAAASQGEEALAALRQAVTEDDPFVLAILDMNMSSMDGASLGRAIKDDPAIGQTLLIMLTSQAKRGDTAQLKSIGFAGYLAKPVKPSLLFDCLLTVLGEQEAGTAEEAAPHIVTRHTLAEDTAWAKAERGRYRILLAEDNIVNQRVALKILEKLGFHADVVPDGREALKAVEAAPYDLVLMDCQMPDMDGYEATAAIRAMKSDIARIPIVAMTAHAMKGDREKCIAAGMDDYVSKPVDPRALDTTLGKWLASPDAPQHEPDTEPTTEPNESIEPPIFDRVSLLDRLMGDEELAEEVLEEFLKRTPGLIASLKSAAAEGDAATVRREAHTIKGSAANVGAEALRETGHRIEQAAESQNLALAASLIPTLDEQFDAFRKLVTSP